MANCYASKIVEIAKSQVGVKETGNNITKYSEDFDKNYPDFYNTRKQGAEWCDIFYDWCMVKAFGEADALRLLCQPKKSCGAGTYYSYGYYKKKKQVGKIAKVGSQIFFSKDGKESGICHTGMVVAVDSNKVYTIEGNKGNKVSECSYNLNDSYIYGYGYPAFDEEPKKGNSEPIKAIPDAPVNYYVIQSGDTLSKIAKKYKTTVANLVSMNQIPDKNKIYAGQKIKVPATPVEPVKESAPKKMIGVIITEVYPLNIRSTKSSAYPTNIVGTIAKGAEVEISAVEGDWCKLADGRGYIFKKYVLIK